MGDNRLLGDGAQTPIQLFAPDPSMSQVPATINNGATKSDININSPLRWTAIEFRVTGDVQVYFNTDTTKFKTYGTGVQHILGLHPSVTAINFKNAGGSAITLEVFGM